MDTQSNGQIDGAGCGVEDIELIISKPYLKVSNFKNTDKIRDDWKEVVNQSLWIYAQIILLVSLSGCQILGDNDNLIFNYKYLMQDWVHSFEEETLNSEGISEVKIFRPEGYKEFEAARYRKVYLIRSDGILEWLAIGSSDGHYLEDGLWMLLESEDSQPVLAINERGWVRYKIHELTPTLLRISEIKSAPSS